MALKSAYSAVQLAKILSLTSRAILFRAAREDWKSRDRAGRGGGKEWLVSSMPEETQLAIRAAEEKQALGEEKSLPQKQLSSVTPPILDDKKRYKALARADLLRQYLVWQRKNGATKAQKAAFVEAYRAGVWPKLLEEIGPVSWQTLERWKVKQERAGSVLILADRRGVAHRGRTLLTERHQHIILGHVLNPNAPAISQCVREVQRKFQAEGMFVPSDPTIRRFAKAYMTECFDSWTAFREGEKAWNDKCAISLLRNWNLVEVGDVVIADGHTLNFESIDPDTGKPKRMTLVLFYDGASNCPLGWQIMATENTACISAAFRRSCIILGKFPRVIYLDNGRAFRARFFEGCPDFEQAGFLGLYRDLGCTVIHAWPYHGQSKPVERFFGTMHELEVWMPSYTGYDIAHKPARMMRGEKMHRKLYEKMGARPLTLEETKLQVARWFEEYKARPQFRTHLHGATPGAVMEAGRGPGLTPEEMQRLTLLMMQKEVRTITKDGIRINGRLYWHEALFSRRHPVLVRYDEYLNPFSVFVYTLDGTFLCEALDREHHRIACGLHPVARVLGTAEQQEDFRAAAELKQGQKKQSFAGITKMLNADVLPEAQARVLSVTQLQPRPIPAARPSEPKPPTAEEEAAFAAQRDAAVAAMNAAPAYTPSALKRWKDSQERYAYLFNVKFEQSIELVPDDVAWMEAWEQTTEYLTYWKKYFDGLRQVYAREQARAAQA
ncbi:MAG: Mu transposase C-terminal domain-containing protein [Desulfovibrio sp.]|nr:Mu transposase C-terminal domain-containing protein [Desulfovibrio sp.]